MSLTPELNPISSAERIVAMDVLRGFALFGILLVNIEGMVGPISAMFSGTNMTLSGIDLWADAATYIFAQGKFYALFSLLFGMGFAIMLVFTCNENRSDVGVVLLCQIKPFSLRFPMKIGRS